MSFARSNFAVHRPSATLSCLILVLLASAPISADQAHGPKLIIESPFDGQILPGNEQRLVEARFEPPLDLSRDLDASIEVIGDGGTTSLGSGDLRNRRAPDRISTVWNLEQTPPGSYRLRVTARAGHAEGSAEVTVRVQPPPLVELYLAAIEATAGPAAQGYRVGFEVAATSPSGTPITELVFNPGDGSPDRLFEAPRFDHRYHRPGAYSVSIEARDDTGTSTFIARDLHLPDAGHEGYLLVVHDPPSGPLVPRHEGPKIPQEKVLKGGAPCGCKSLTITAGRRLARSKVYCADTETPGVLPGRTIERLVGLGCEAMPDAPAGTCPANQVAFDCPLGQRLPTRPTELPASSVLSYPFEVSAVLEPKASANSQCLHGQYAHGDMKINGFAVRNDRVVPGPPTGNITLPRDGGGNFIFEVVPNVDPRTGPSRVPRRAEAKFGADDFAAKDLLVRRLPGTIYWYDQPFIAVTPLATRASNDLEFISFVRGRGGQPTCWCRFTVDQRYDARAGAAADNRILIIDGNRCFAGDGTVIGPF